ncbi:MAG: bifunctional folylpolyglutamate synthase/dihydrofolate synthase [Oscillospiraceae bacterium]|jgi:dihydrofolate synthase/folylpolyglutamate synthase
MTKAEELLRAVPWKNGKPTIARAAELVERMGNPQDSLRTIHIAGTNGKGSVAAMTERILREAGFKTGLFTSPSLIDFNERIRINGRAVTEDELLPVTKEVMKAAAGMQDAPSEFETTAAAMYQLFLEEKCDVCVIETGMGGTFDATNVLRKPAVTAITQVGLDHMQYLGNTVGEIAGEKAGILKEGVPCVLEADDPEAVEVISSRAAGLGCRLIRVDKKAVSGGVWKDRMQSFSYKDRKNLTLSLLGRHQLMNAAAVCEIIDELRRQGMEVPEEAVRTGFENTIWPARFQYLGQGLWVDGGHNPSGIARIVETVRDNLGKVSLLYGTFRDKDWRKNVDELLTVSGPVFLVKLENPRTEEPEIIQDYIRSRGGNAAVCTDIKSGIDAARTAGRGAGMDALAVGSLSLAGSVLKAEGFDCSNI